MAGKKGMGYLQREVARAASATPSETAREKLRQAFEVLREAVMEKHRAERAVVDFAAEVWDFETGRVG